MKKLFLLLFILGLYGEFSTIACMKRKRNGSDNEQQDKKRPKKKRKKRLRGRELVEYIERTKRELRSGGDVNVTPRKSLKNRLKSMSDAELMKYYCKEILPMRDRDHMTHYSDGTEIERMRTILDPEPERSNKKESDEELKKRLGEKRVKSYFDAAARCDVKGDLVGSQYEKKTLSQVKHSIDRMTPHEFSQRLALSSELDRRERRLPKRVASTPRMSREARKELAKKFSRMTWAQLMEYYDRNIRSSSSCNIDKVTERFVRNNRAVMSHEDFDDYAHWIALLDIEDDLLGLQGNALRIHAVDSMTGIEFDRRVLLVRELRGRLEEATRRGMNPQRMVENVERQIGMLPHFKQKNPLPAVPQPVKPAFPPIRPTNNFIEQQQQMLDYFSNSRKKPNIEQPNIEQSLQAQPRDQRVMHYDNFSIVIVPVVTQQTREDSAFHTLFNAVHFFQNNYLVHGGRAMNNNEEFQKYLSRCKGILGIMGFDRDTTKLRSDHIEVIIASDGLLEDLIDESGQFCENVSVIDDLGFPYNDPHVLANIRRFRESNDAQIIIVKADDRWCTIKLFRQGGKDRMLIADPSYNREKKGSLENITKRIYQVFRSNKPTKNNVGSDA